MWLRHVFLLGTILAVTACGGGGGGNDGGDGQATPAPSEDFPVLQTSATFRLPDLPAPPDRTPVAGKYMGRVLLASGATARAGLRVDLLDATYPTTPRLMASGTTGENGDFVIAGTNDIAPVDQWLQVMLDNGAVLRAYPTGWTEITAGTEVAVAQISRLHQAGGLSGRPLLVSELALAQESVSLLWQARYVGSGYSTTDVIADLHAFLSLHDPWNLLLQDLGLATKRGVVADVSELLPHSGETVISPSTLLESDVPYPVAVAVHTTCLLGSYPLSSACMLSTNGRADLSEQLLVRHTGILLNPMASSANGVDQIMAQVGPLPLLEFAPSIGTRVIYDNQRFVLQADPTIHAAIKITRRTYPAETMQALGRSIQAIQVVFDYEISLLNISTRQQADLLVRERRWFSPGGGRIRIESTGVARAGGQQVTSSVSLTANSVSGVFSSRKELPAAGKIDVRSAALPHRHAVYWEPLNRIYVASPGAAGGGQILELDATTLAILRTVATPGVPARLAVSRDSGRLYVGQDGGSVVEFVIPTLGIARQFGLVPTPDGQAYDRVYDLAVDPHDPSRVLLLAGQSTIFGASGAVLIYQNGTLLLRDAPRYSARDYGWGYYSPNAVAWSSVQNEFLTGSLGSPQNLYRFRAGADASTEVAALTRVDHIGMRDVGGEIVTSSGMLIAAGTLTPLRTFAFGSYRLRNCLRLDATSYLCEMEGSTTMTAPTMYVRLDANTGAYLGSYRPAIDNVMSACADGTSMEPSVGLGDARLTPLGDGRILVSTGSGDVRCSVQVWTLHGGNL